MKLLYYAPFSQGGLADYGHCQAMALAKLGVEVTLLCPADEEGPWNRLPAEERGYMIRPILQQRKIFKLGSLVRKLTYCRNLIAGISKLADEITRGRFERVLFGTYSEYLAPLWAGKLRHLTRTHGTVFGAVVHDPVRDFVVGPHWWHQRSIAASYSTLREAFVHAPITLETGRPMPDLRTTVIPQGLYQFPPANTSRARWRSELALPPDAKVLLSFGFLRDNKNLDLTLEALVSQPDLYLVVAGNEQSATQKSARAYQETAEKLEVAKRCRWLVRFIPQQEVGGIIGGCDLALLTYSRSFRSASAVLNVLANFRMPFLASGGEGNLRGIVQEYAPDAWIEPDSLDSLRAGLSRWLAGSMRTPPWDEYLANHSWERNAAIVARRMDVLPA